MSTPAQSRLKGLFAVALLAAGCEPRLAPILLFDGEGTSPNDVAAIETILTTNGFDYATANSRQLNAMSSARLRQYRLLLVPGGNFLVMGKNIKPSTGKVHDAVQSGLNYLGVCAGAFLAGDTASYDSFKLTPGVRFNFYSAEARGVRKAAVAIASPGAPTLDGRTPRSAGALARGARVQHARERGPRVLHVARQSRARARAAAALLIRSRQSSLCSRHGRERCAAPRVHSRNRRA